MLNTNILHSCFIKNKSSKLHFPKDPDIKDLETMNLTPSIFKIGTEWGFPNARNAIFRVIFTILILHKSCIMILNFSNYTGVLLSMT